MADEAIAYLNQLNALDPKKPFFLYYAPGGTHAPHHPTPEWIEKFKGKFGMGWNALRDQIFANQKKLGVIPQERRAHALALRHSQELGRPQHRRQEAVRAADGGLRRLPRLYRPRDRPRGAGRRGHGQARQHADHLHQRRQWRQRRRLARRHAERDDVLQRRRGAGRGAAEVLRGVGLAIHLSAHGGRLDLGDEHALQMDQADPVLFRRHPQRHGDRLAGPHQGRRRHPQPVPSCHRYRSDPPRGDRHPRAGDGRRHHPDADRRGQSRLHLRQGERVGALDAQDPVFRDVRQSRALPRRLDRLDGALSRAVERHRADAEGCRERRQVGAVRSDQGLDAEPRPVGGEPREAERAARFVLGRGSQVSGLAARCLGADPFRPSAPEHRRRPHRVHLHQADRRRAAEHGAERPQQVLRHHRRHRSARKAAATACW